MTDNEIALRSLETATKALTLIESHERDCIDIRKRIYAELEDNSNDLKEWRKEDRERAERIHARIDELSRQRFTLAVRVGGVLVAIIFGLVGAVWYLSNHGLPWSG